MVCNLHDDTHLSNRSLYKTKPRRSITMGRVALLCATLFICCLHQVCGQKYTPDWDSLDARPLPTWYDEAKFGIFVHWGVYSVPSFGSEWFWQRWQENQHPYFVQFMEKNYKPGFTYAEFGPQFTAEFFHPIHWARVFKASGAKYVVLTTKHHEGYTLWPSEYSYSWNSMEVGPHRDLVGDFVSAIRARTNIRVGLYHSLYEWFNQLYLKDKENNFTTQAFVKSKTLPELIEVVNRYKPELIWSDGDWEAPDTYWNSQEFLAWLYNDSPVKDSVVVNDRWGNGTACNHGGYLTCVDRFQPGTLLSRKWENAMTIDRFSWGYRRTASLGEYLSLRKLVLTLVETVSYGGNLLLNVGATKEGTILPIFEERLRGIGKWLSTNGEGIYSTVPWLYQNDMITDDVWYTQKNGTSHVDPAVYAITTFWPESDTLSLGAPVTSLDTKVYLLGYPEILSWKARDDGGIDITIPMLNVNQNPSENAWVFKMTNVEAL